MGYPSALSAKGWGFEDVLFAGKPIVLERPLGDYVMENVLFKISFPAEFHAQTAVEAALRLHAQVRHRLDGVSRVVIDTQEAACRIIDKSGPLANPADRDHCLQYMVAVALIFGRLTADDYEDETARDRRIDTLREKMTVREEPGFSLGYFDPDKRSIANAVQVFHDDGSSTERVVVEYPVGHRVRREEGIPLLVEKFRNNLASRFGEPQRNRIEAAFRDDAKLEQMPVDEFMELWVRPA